MAHTTTLRRLRSDLGELLERHGAGRDLDAFAAYRDRPVAFIREVLDGEPWSAQVEIAEAVRDAPLVVVRSANAVGKDWTAARLALWWAYARRGLVLLTGPTERQVVEVVMGEVARAWSGSELPGELYRSALRLGREEKAGILAFTSTEASRLTGFHAPRVMAVLTEAQGVEDFAWEGLLACATGSEDRLLALGNPVAPSGRFYVVSRSDGWRAVQIAASEHPNVREGREVIPGGPSPAFAERIAQEYGEGSGVYRSRVLGEFPDEGEDSLFARSWIDAAFRRHAEGFGGGAPPVVAVDPARYGPDATVMAVRRGDRVEELVGWHGRSTMETVTRLRQELDRVGVTPRYPASEWNAEVPSEGEVVVDTVGLGAGVHDRLHELCYPVSGFNGGEGARDGDRFLNRRAEAYWELRERLEAGEVALPPSEKLAEELLAVRWRPTPTGKVQLASKDDLRGRIGRSPDRADAVTMALYSRAVARARFQPFTFTLTP